METPDPRHVRFELKKPWPDFLTFYASATGAGWIVPKKYVEKVGDDGFKKAPVGAGPYKFVSFTPGVELVMEAFDELLAQDPERQAHRVQGDSRRGDAAGGAEARRGRHRLLDPRRARRGAAARRRDSPSKPVVTTARSGSISPTSGTRNRRGTTSACGGRRSLAIDRKCINQALTLGPFARSPTASSPTASTSTGSRRRPVYDPAKAKELLAEAGHPNGFDAGELLLRLVLRQSRRGGAQQSRRKSASALKLRPLERAAFFKRLCREEA